MFNDWLIYKMSGHLAVEPSNGSTSGLFSLVERTWDKTIAERCGLRSDIFPDTQECGTLAATVSKAGERETGLREGTPLIVGGGDAQLGTIGVGVTEANSAAIFGGTFWQYEYNADSGIISDSCDIRVNCHAQQNLWQYEARDCSCGGTVTDFVKQKREKRLHSEKTCTRLWTSGQQTSLREAMACFALQATL